MTAKEELSQFKYIRKRVDEALEEYEKYKDRATKMTSVLSDMPKGGKSSDKVADNAVKMADISRIYEERWLEAERYKLKVEDRINEIDEPYRTLLHMKYVEGKTLEEISTKIGYSFDRVRHLHGIALLKYNKVDTQ